MLRMNLYVLLVLSLLPAQAPQPNQPVTIDKLRALILADAGATPSQQHIRFGPMKNGRTLSITTQTVNDSSAVTIEGQGRDIFVIQMGRTLAVKSVYLLDAMIICGRYPKAACDRMEAYIDHLSKSPSPAQTHFLEEVFPELRQAAETTRADGALYWASLVSGITSLTVMITLHETAHAALGHLAHPTSDTAVRIGEEGEADGFAAYVAEEGKLPPMGMNVAFMLDAVEQASTGRAAVVHPPAICRVGLNTRDSIDWMLHNRTAILAPSNSKARVQIAKNMFEHISPMSQLGVFDASWELKCKPYMISFATGFARAAELVNQNTKIDSTIPGQK